jgi:hypothetical protein
MQVAE